MLDAVTLVTVGVAALATAMRYGLSVTPVGSCILWLVGPAFIGAGVCLPFGRPGLGAVRGVVTLIGFTLWIVTSC